MTPYELAKGEIGIKEIVGDEDNPRIIEYHATTTLKATSDEISWCSSFVNWSVTKSGKRGTNSAAARSWLNWGVVLDSPVEGCIVIFKRGSNPASGHVGFFVKKEKGLIHVLGGNQSNQVKISPYKEEDVLGYRAVA